jgi:hypothetical protein
MQQIVRSALGTSCQCTLPPSSIRNLWRAFRNHQIIKVSTRLSRQNRSSTPKSSVISRRLWVARCTICRRSQTTRGFSPTVQKEIERHRPAR